VLLNTHIVLLIFKLFHDIRLKLVPVFMIGRHSRRTQTDQPDRRSTGEEAPAKKKKKNEEPEQKETERVHLCQEKGKKEDDQERSAQKKRGGI
jgi:hypothetical protein